MSPKICGLITALVPLSLNFFSHYRPSKQNNATGIYGIAPIEFNYSNIEECLRQVPTYVNDASDKIYCPSTSTKNNRYSLFGHQCTGIQTLFLLGFLAPNSKKILLSVHVSLFSRLVSCCGVV